MSAATRLSYHLDRETKLSREALEVGVSAGHLAILALLA